MKFDVNVVTVVIVFVLILEDSPVGVPGDCVMIILCRNFSGK